MKRWTKYSTGLVAAASLTTGARAQVPSVPTTPAAAAAAAPTAATTSPQTLWSFLGLTKEQKEELKRKCCKTQFGQFLNNALKPVSIFSGGILGNFCPQTPTAEDLAKPGAEGAAAQIMADEANAKARRAAVRYLGTVDCHYWGPVAEPALIAALRTDRNECVRWEAAMALGRGCCCTKKTITALAITVSGSEKDGNPSEKSDRVKGAATLALEHCLSCYHEVAPAPATTPEETPPPKRLEPPPAKPVEPPPTPAAEKSAALYGTDVQLAAYYRTVESTMTLKQVVENAQRMLQERGHVLVGSAPPQGYAGGSVYELLLQSVGAKGHTEMAPVAPVAPAPVAEVAPADVRLVPVGANLPAASDARPTPAPGTPVGPQSAAPSPVVPAPVLATAPPPVAAPVVLPMTRPVAVVSSVPAAPVPPAPVPVQLAAPPTPMSTGATMTTAQMMATLREAFYPDQREWAAIHLATNENRADPQVLNALLESARKDTAAIVRAACVRSLALLGVNTPAVLEVLQSLKTDTDPRVRLAVQKALTALGAAPLVTLGSTVKAHTEPFVVPVR